MLNSLSASVKESGLGEVNTESVLGAEKLVKYYTSMAKKVKFEILENISAKKVLKINENKSIKDKINSLKQSQPDISNTKIAKVLGVSRTTVQKYLKT